MLINHTFLLNTTAFSSRGLPRRERKYYQVSQNMLLHDPTPTTLLLVKVILDSPFTTLQSQVVSYRICKKNK